MGSHLFQTQVERNHTSARFSWVKTETDTIISGDFAAQFRCVALRSKAVLLFLNAESSAFLCRSEEASCPLRSAVNSVIFKLTQRNAAKR